MLFEVLGAMENKNMLENNDVTCMLDNEFSIMLSQIYIHKYQLQL